MNTQYLVIFENNQGEQEVSEWMQRSSRVQTFITHLYSQGVRKNVNVMYFENNLMIEKISILNGTLYQTPGEEVKIKIAK